MAGKKKKAKGKSDHRLNGQAEPYRDVFWRLQDVIEEILRNKPPNKRGREHWTPDEIERFEITRQVVVRTAERLGLSTQEQMTLQTAVLKNRMEYKERNRREVDEPVRNG